jgi:poly-gamma-glutamate capsule biosynthesis protein CapA/YwtB (metallophosphatase superfamily)
VSTTLISGRALCRHLTSLGVPAQKIVRKQETGDYLADFFVPEMTEPVAPAKEWARRIQEVLPSARIIDTHDTIAAWRPNRPVIYATVIFKLEDSEGV